MNILLVFLGLLPFNMGSQSPKDETQSFLKSVIKYSDTYPVKNILIVSFFILVSIIIIGCYYISKRNSRKEDGKITLIPTATTSFTPFRKTHYRKLSDEDYTGGSKTSSPKKLIPILEAGDRRTRKN